MKAFFAYPSGQAEVIRAIHGAKLIASTSPRRIDVQLWEENDISGRPLTDPIFEEIAKSEFLIADITFTNFNVTFEIGYAIGNGKRVYLTRNTNFKKDNNLIDSIGIFDTLGYESYSDEIGLASLISSYNDFKVIPLRTLTDAKSPVYILQTPQSSTSMIAITARIKSARLGYRSHIPSDEPRLSAAKAIDGVSGCLGAVIPLLPVSYADAHVHNIRAAFVAGLSIALEKETLILQPRDGPAPIDVRDLVTTFDQNREISDAIAAFALNVTEKLQAYEPLPLPKGNFLAELSIGDSVAENEFQTLGNYYLRTDQYKRASRGEINMVLGRKGTGKTALFSQLRNEKRSNVRNIIVDLKPEGYQLIRLKESVLDYLADGARMHLITALFEYVLYLEICYKLLEKDRVKHTRDARLYEPYRKLLSVYESGKAGEGDFSERLLSLSQELVDAFRSRFGNNANQRLTASEVTELIHKREVRDIREALSIYLRFKESVWILFDNLDKGWSPHGLTDDDVMILRCLIDAARKIQHQLQRDNHDFHCIVFVRNDVY
jgi:hypothetical protein